MAKKITVALVIREPWIGMILAGHKTWELRSQPNYRSGRIALAAKGGLLVGSAQIAPSMTLNREQIAAGFVCHRCPAEAIAEFFGRKQVYAWPLSKVRRIKPPIEYQHPGGGSWVSLTARNVKRWRTLQEAA